MRARLVGGVSVTLLAGAVACATAESDRGAPTTELDAGATARVDAASDASEQDSALPDALAAECSPAGWCETTLPDRDAVMKNIWPLADSAFAIAETTTLGVKVMEWTRAEPSWKYIDDGTQNEDERGGYAGSIWSPDEDEVFYTVAPGYVYHGKRSPPRVGAWSWSRTKLEDHSHVAEAGHAAHDHGALQTIATGAFASNAPEMADPALGVWGIGKNDVYAWYSNTIYRLSIGDGDTETWVPEYIADDHDSTNEHLFFLSAAGTSADNLWFTGTRATRIGACALAVRKTAAGYRRVVDCRFSGTFTILERPGTLFVDMQGSLMDSQAVGPDGVVGIINADTMARIESTGAGDSVSLSTAPMAGIRTDLGYSSMWRAPAETWLAGWGIVLHNDDAWDAGTYEVSTVAQNGSPVPTLFNQVRGTLSTNLWTIGSGYALHKTTP